MAAPASGRHGPRAKASLSPSLRQGYGGLPSVADRMPPGRPTRAAGVARGVGLALWLRIENGDQRGQQAGRCEGTGSRARCSSCSSGRRKPSGSVITIRIGADLWRASGTALHISLDKTRLPHRRNQDFHFWIFTVSSEQKFPHNFANAPIKGTTNVRQVMVAEWARLTEAEMVSPQSSGKTTRSGAQTSSSAPQPKVLFRP
jgi:hypothetical protein